MMKKITLPLLLAFLVSSVFSSNSYSAVNKAPDISLPTIKGEMTLESLKGKVVYLDFWASWCEPCKKSFPWMQEIKQRYAEQGFEILAVSLDKDRTLADEFLNEMSVNFIVAFDESGETASSYKLKGMPSSYLIGRDGSVYASHVGFRDKDKERLEQAIVDMLNKK